MYYMYHGSGEGRQGNRITYPSIPPGEKPALTVQDAALAPTEGPLRRPRLLAFFTSIAWHGVLVLLLAVRHQCPSVRFVCVISGARVAIYSIHGEQGTILAIFGLFEASTLGRRWEQGTIASLNEGRGSQSSTLGCDMPG